MLTPSWPSPQEKLERIENINHQPTIATSSFNNGWDTPTHAGMANDVRFYDASTGELLNSFKCGNEIFDARLSRDEARLYTAAWSEDDLGW